MGKSEKLRRTGGRAKATVVQSRAYRMRAQRRLYKDALCRFLSRRPLFAAASSSPPFSPHDMPNKFSAMEKGIMVNTSFQTPCRHAGRACTLHVCHWYRPSSALPLSGTIYALVQLPPPSSRFRHFLFCHTCRTPVTHTFAAVAVYVHHPIAFCHARIALLCPSRASEMNQ